MKTEQLDRDKIDDGDVLKVEKITRLNGGTFINLVLSHKCNFGGILLTKQELEWLLSELK